ncbi:MAG: amino acid--tRNA ligase-related protein, partial [Candidatus Woesearchaeota archaeon]
MLGPYHANKDGTISYRGNKIFRPIKDVLEIDVSVNEIKNRVESLKNNDVWFHLSKINHSINKSANEFFDKEGALFITLPLTTRMISSPCAVYGKYKLNYIKDTCPITLKWFNLPKKVFLSESSQIYLELALLQKNINKAYSIYNSFRKERADVTHLSEFHHIEFEGKISQEENEKMVLKLIKKIIFDLFKSHKEDLSYFLTESKLEELKKFAKNILKTPKITF